MATVAFKKGLLANLPSTYTEGTWYVTTDEPGLYLDISDSERVRIGDFQEFETLAELQGNTNPSTTALYYVKDINCLAKWNGSSYIQINPDTGATSIEVTGSGNAVTAASYDAASRKLTLTKGATYTTSTDVDSQIGAKIGDLGDDDEGSPYTTVKAYVDEKIADVVAGSVEGLGALASKDKVAESDLDTTLAAKLNGKADVGSSSDEASANTIYGAKAYADDAAEAAQTAAESHADAAIAALDVEDTPVANQVVTGVSETDGKITVTRRALAADDIPELAQGKITGLTAALAGKQDTVVFNTQYDASSNKAATMADVNNAVADLSGAMHYEGNSTTDPNGDTGPTVADHEGDWAKGDVVTYNAKEFVYDGSTWRELGDESSFAVKGSIKNADIASDAAIDQSKIAGLTDALDSKVEAQDITDAIAALDVTDEAVANQFVTAVSETDGKVAVTRRGLTAADVPTLDQSKINGLEAALAGKQDTVVFNTTYNETSNKAATMSDVDAAETAAKEYADGLADNYDAAGSADTALTNAKSYTDEKLSAALAWGTF